MSSGASSMVSSRSDAAASGGEEPYGTTPLPVTVSGSPVRVVFDDGVSAMGKAQQPQASNIATFESLRSDECINGTILDANNQFVVYVVKNGLVRVLHRHTTLRALLRGHKGQTVTDIRFFRNGDVVASAGHQPNAAAGGGGGGGGGVRSTVMIWRIFARDTEILSEVLLEISSPHVKITRIVWHPFNVNQFWMIHTDSRGKTIATLVETTRIATHAAAAVQPSDSASGAGNGGQQFQQQQQHAVCDWFDDYTVMRGAVQLKYGDGDLTDLCWNLRENRHVLTCHDSGEVVLWDLKRLTPDAASSVVVPAVVSVIRTDEPLSRCLFVPHERALLRGGADDAGEDTLTTCFVTASDNNRVLTLWSPFNAPRQPQSGLGTPNVPSKLQILEFEDPASSYLIDACYSGAAPADASPPSCFLVAAARDAGKIFAFSLKSQWTESAKSNSAAAGAGSGGTAGGDDAAASRKAQQLVGCDYVVPFVTKYPTFAWSTMVLSTTDIADEEIVSTSDDDNEAGDQQVVSAAGGGGLIFDMKLFCYQSSVVQSLTLTALSCLPPENSWVDPTPGVRYQRLLEGARSAHVSDIDSREDNNIDANLVFDEDEYDVDEDDVGNVDDAPEPSALPPPPTGFIVPPTTASTVPAAAATAPTQPASLTNNPFANWLGAIASKPTAAAPAAAMPVLTPTNRPGPVATAATAAVTAAGALQPAAPPPPPGLGVAEDVPPSAPVEQQPQQTSFLTDLLKGSTPAPPPAPKQQQQQQQKQQKPPVKKKKGRSKSPKPPPSAAAQSQGKVAILKRDDEPSEPKAGAGSAVPQATSNGNQMASNEDIRHAIREEFRDSILPHIEKMIHSSTAAVFQPLQASITRLGKDGVQVDTDAIAASLSESADVPLKAAFADSVKNVLIPTLESVTSQAFVQISEHLEQGLSSKQDASDAAAAGTSKEMEAISTQLTTMTSLVAKLTTEVQSLRSTVESQQAMISAAAAGSVGATPAPPAPPALSREEVVRNQVLAFLQEESYETAFTEAVKAVTPGLVPFCCANADINKVLGGSSPKISQPMLICLMQQLGADFSSPRTTDAATLDMEIEWLSEIALCLNPADAQIHNHVPGVLQLVVKGINERLAKTADQTLRRKLQRLLQVIRGMQMG